MRVIKEVLLGYKPNNLIVILIAVITAIGSIFGATVVSNKNIATLKTEISQQIKISNTQNITTNVGEPSKGILSTDTQNNNAFDPEEWNFVRKISLDKEGYYCPDYTIFPSWFMWTKNRYKANSVFSISFALLDKTVYNDKNPTLYISYGDKTSDAPDAFYRLNLLDGDLNTIRLYDRSDQEVKFERSKTIIPIDKYLTFEISPIFPNKNSSALILNPLLYYQIDGEKNDFDPKKEFKVTLPILSGDDQGDGFQYGIGVSKGDCFKINSVNI